MNKLVKLCLVSVVAILLTACDTTNQTMGTATGGIIGGVIGSQFGGGTGRTAATIGGTVVGAMIGGSIGRSMDQQDRMKVDMALERTPTGQSTSWVNPDSHAQYTVTPTKTVTASNGQPCREYSTSAMVGGKQQQIYGKACRDASGAWKVVS